MKKITSFPSLLHFSLGILLGAALFTTGSVALAAYVGPPGSPTTCPTGYQGCDAPLNVSTAVQTKLGNLIIGAGATGVGVVTSGWYGDTVNLAARTPSPSGATYFQDQGGARTWAIIGAPVDGVYSQTNMNANDYYIRAIGKWASQLGGGSTTITENKFGGMYALTSSEQNRGLRCYSGNVFTGGSQPTVNVFNTNNTSTGCSCPAWAPNARYLTLAMTDYTSSNKVFTHIYYCYKP